MAKFNKKEKGEKLTKNKEGHAAYELESKEKLATMVLTSLFGEEKFYGDNTNELMALAKELIEKDQARFVANLAVFARNEMNLRSISHALCALLAKEEKGKEFVKYAVLGVCRRSDDITEILSFYIEVYGKPIPNSLKKALACAMNRFDEYQFAKYNGGNKGLKFIDVLRLTHAKAESEEQNRIFNAIINDTLKTPYTWEAELSQKGNTKEVWEELIDSDKVGIMALTRNLNNILNAKPKNLKKVLDKFKDEKTILNSKMLPFRFYSAYKMIVKNENSSSTVFDALETAVEISTKNIETLKGKTLIAIDVSGSMNTPVSKRSMVTASNIATLLGSMANSVCEDAIVVSFDTNLYKHAFSKKNGIITNAELIDTTGGGTDIRLPIQYLLDNKIFVDRIILLSDNEINRGYDHPILYYGKTCCQDHLNEYKKKINKNVIFHGIDLVGYGTSQFKGKNVNLLAGWSERVFEVINIFENGIGSLVDTIENYSEVSEYADTNAEG